MIIASLLLCPVYLRYSAQVRAGLPMHLSIFFVGTLNVVFTVLLVFSLQLLSASVNTLLLYLYPIFTAVLAFFILNEKLTPIKIGALVGALTGVFLIVYAPDAVVNMKGVALVVGAALVNATMMVAIRKSVAGVPPLMLSTGNLTWAGVSMVIIGMFLRIPLVAEMTAPGLVIIFTLAVVPTVLALVFLNFGLNYVEASYSSIIMTIEPLLTAILAVIFLKERLTLFQSLGGLVILGSLLLLTSGERISVRLQPKRMDESKIS